MKTKVSVKGQDFYINDRKVYSELPNKEHHGLLMNARFIQGIFDDKSGRERYNRYNQTFDPFKNTNDLIDALPSWYEKGLRAFTVGIQGGGPCFTIDNKTIENQPFLEHGLMIDPDYLERLDRLIVAADELGMVVIVSLFYPGQANDRMIDGLHIENSVKTACEFLKDHGYTNIILEICNEYDLLTNHSTLGTGEGMASTIRKAQNWLPGVPVGSSLIGGNINKEVAKTSDVILIHGNGQSRGQYYNMIKTIKSWNLDKPILCNEDSQAIGNMVVSMKEHVSWGYYNNMTKQEPPVYWEITEGEDQFFAQRMAIELGIEEVPTDKNTTYLQGLEQHMTYEDKRWIRLASLYPELINYVEFYYDNDLYEVAYDEPFMVNFKCNWLQGPVIGTDPDKWTCKVIYK